MRYRSFPRLPLLLLGTLLLGSFSVVGVVSPTSEGCTRLWKFAIQFDGIFEGLGVQPRFSKLSRETIPDAWAGQAGMVFNETSVWQFSSAVAIPVLFDLVDAVFDDTALGGFNRGKKRLSALCFERLFSHHDHGAVIEARIIQLQARYHQ